MRGSDLTAQTNLATMPNQCHGTAAAQDFVLEVSLIDERNWSCQKRNHSAAGGVVDAAANQGQSFIECLSLLRSSLIDRP